MTRELLSSKLDNLSTIIQNVQRSLQFTNIPVGVLVNYLQKETGIVVDDLKVKEKVEINDRK